jgi:hypothetical protein
LLGEAEGLGVGLVVLTPKTPLEGVGVGIAVVVGVGCEPGLGVTTTPPIVAHSLRVAWPP